MKLPADLLSRENLFWDLTLRCLTSRETRKAEYDRLRAYYLFGAAPDSQQAMYNKIFPSIDLLTSFLFAADTTRFSIQLGAGVDPQELKKEPPLVSRLNDRWQDSNADSLFGLGVTWALVNNTMLIKLIQRGNETVPFLIEPHNFGVLREEITMLSRQEAFVHVFYTTRAQLERDLHAHPNKASILARLTGRPREQSEMPAGVQRIVVASQRPLSTTMTGNVNDVLAGQQQYRPMSDEELIEMYELWVWNDDAPGKYSEAMGKTGDYQVVTLADPQVCIYDRPSGRDMFLAGEQPFTQICPNPAPDYFWGYSEVARLTTLQDLREQHLAQLNELINRNVNTSKALQGMWKSPDESEFALRKLGSILSSVDPTAKVQEFKPQIPTDLWQIITAIDGMFDESIALNNLTKGRGDTGVRSMGQTESLLRVGTSRPKKRALIIEDSLERIATLYLKLDQQHDPDPLRTADNLEFISHQFTEDYMVKVDAHSSSPVFVEEQKNLAFELFDRQVIDGDSLLDILQPQNLQVLKERYKGIIQAKQAAAQKEELLRTAEVQGKVSRIGGAG